MHTRILVSILTTVIHPLNHTKKAQTKSRPSLNPDSFRKGLEFEKYVIGLFNKENFKLIKHREAKIMEGRLLTADLAYPDLEMIFGKYSKHPFAVECKWRKSFQEGKINLATDFQIHSYINFEKAYHIPVFIAIGIGGLPSSPECLFVTPLRNIENMTEVYETDLIPYKKEIGRRLFYHPVQMKLF
ncbi:MAG: hypothetical protein EOO09_13235 [Chitinophagaceae bacterium]|nr:MAG: hypothetical protein EOO09_13235 [Chitinophagaceae bacterium]